MRISKQAPPSAEPLVPTHQLEMAYTTINSCLPLLETVCPGCSTHSMWHLHKGLVQMMWCIPAYDASFPCLLLSAVKDMTAGASTPRVMTSA